MGEVQLFVLGCSLLVIGLVTIAVNLRGIFADRAKWAPIEPLEPWPAPPQAPVTELPEHVEKWVYWTLDKTGKPMCHFCDGPLGHPHIHLVRIPIPADVLACSEDIKNPPLCLIHDKFSWATGPCLKQESESTCP